MIENIKSDREGYNKLYKGNMLNYGTKEEFEQSFEGQLKPFCQNGITKGYVRGLSTKLLLEAAAAKRKSPSEIVIIDAGCGLGGLSAYLALKGFNVIGIDISEEARTACENLAEKLEIQDRCTFYAASLEDIPISESSVDFIIGHASLHHFIKYKEVPNEFYRVLKIGGQGFFADSFGENKLYSLFHNKEEMKRLGDVSLTKDMVVNYFKDLNPTIIPTDWFVMLDKLYLKLFPSRMEYALRKISKLHFWLDRRIATNSNLALRLSGSIITSITKK